MSCHRRALASGWGFAPARQTVHDSRRLPHESRTRSSLVRASSENLCQPSRTGNPLPHGSGADHGRRVVSPGRRTLQALQRETDRNGAPHVVATQVKEKLGGLHFYVRGSSERQRATIETAVELSMHICESCGSPGHLGHFIDGGVATRCGRHAAGGFVSEPPAPAAGTGHDRPWSARRDRPGRTACSVPD